VISPYTLEELESALLNKQAAANKLTALDNNGDPKNPLTEATFTKLGPGKRPKPLHLALEGTNPPAGTVLVCSGTVFISGQKTDVSAFREM
jgi:hypothetical protein